jgi:hypothetical protein
MKFSFTKSESWYGWVEITGGLTTINAISINQDVSKFVHNFFNLSNGIFFSNALLLWISHGINLKPKTTLTFWCKLYLYHSFKYLVLQWNFRIIDISNLLKFYYGLRDLGEKNHSLQCKIFALAISALYISK